MTALDRVNPVTRIGAALILTLPLLVTLDSVSAGVGLAMEVACFLALGFRLRAMLRRTWPILVAAPVAGLSMLLYGKAGGETYLQWSLVHVTSNSANLGLAAALRVLALGVPTVLLLTDVDPTDMADGLAQVVRLPARFVLGSLAGFRLAGAFREDWRNLQLARRARGLGDTGAFRRWLTMAFAMLVIALRRGSRLATAMEARAFGGPAARSWARPSTVGRADAVLLAASAALVTLAITASVWSGAFHVVWS